MLTWLEDHGDTNRLTWPTVVVCCLMVLLSTAPGEASRGLPDPFRPTLDGPFTQPADLERPAPQTKTLPFFSAADLEALSSGTQNDYDDGSRFCIYNGPDRLSPYGGGGFTHPHLFQGLWTDPVTGIAYARNRWYDARTASWLSEDPMGAVDSPNLYAFVGWGPQAARDPMGLWQIDPEVAGLPDWDPASAGSIVGQASALLSSAASREYLERRYGEKLRRLNMTVDQLIAKTISAGDGPKLRFNTRHMIGYARGQFTAWENTIYMRSADRDYVSKMPDAMEPFADDARASLAILLGHEAIHFMDFFVHNALSANDDPDQVARNAPYSLGEEEAGSGKTRVRRYGPARSHKKSYDATTNTWVRSDTADKWEVMVVGSADNFVPDSLGPYVWDVDDILAAWSLRNRARSAIDDTVPGDEMARRRREVEIRLEREQKGMATPNWRGEWIPEIVIPPAPRN